MSKTEDIKKYREEKTLMLIEEHKDIIDKYEKLFDKDLLADEIDGIKSKDEDTRKDSESKYLRKLDEKTKALKKIEESLDTIERLETNMNKDNKVNGSQPASSTPTHPTQRHAKKT